MSERFIDSTATALPKSKTCNHFVQGTGDWMVHRKKQRVNYMKYWDSNQQREEGFQRADRILLRLFDYDPEKKEQIEFANEDDSSRDEQGTGPEAPQLRLRQRLNVAHIKSHIIYNAKSASKHNGPP
ncbi:hypothetical protein BGX34_006756 [Mortierella sp. NVP85]|nr:hypothetical protein BGX34_006756 [Mortierella sp. NVP85]